MPQSMGSQRVRHDRATELTENTVSTFRFMEQLGVGGGINVKKPDKEQLFTEGKRGKCPLM